MSNSINRQQDRRERRQQQRERASQQAEARNRDRQRRRLADEEGVDPSNIVIDESGDPRLHPRIEYGREVDEQVDNVDIDPQNDVVYDDDTLRLSSEAESRIDTAQREAAAADFDEEIDAIDIRPEDIAVSEGEGGDQYVLGDGARDRLEQAERERAAQEYNQDISGVDISADDIVVADDELQLSDDARDRVSDYQRNRAAAEIDNEIDGIDVSPGDLVEQDGTFELSSEIQDEYQEQQRREVAAEFDNEIELVDIGTEDIVQDGDQYRISPEIEGEITEKNREQAAEEFNDEIGLVDIGPDDIVEDDGAFVLSTESKAEFQDAQRENAAQQFNDELDLVDIGTDDIVVDDDQFVLSDEAEAEFQDAQRENAAQQFDDEIGLVDIGTDDVVVEDDQFVLSDPAESEFQEAQREDAAQQFDEEIGLVDIGTDDIVVDDDQFVLSDEAEAEFQDAQRENAAQQFDDEIGLVDIGTDDVVVEDDQFVLSDPAESEFQEAQREDAAQQFDEEIELVDVGTDDVVVEDDQFVLSDEAEDEFQDAQRENAAQQFDNEIDLLDIGTDDVVVEDDQFVLSDPAESEFQEAQRKEVADEIESDIQEDLDDPGLDLDADDIVIGTGDKVDSDEYLREEGITQDDVKEMSAREVADILEDRPLEERYELSEEAREEVEELYAEQNIEELGDSLEDPRDVYIPPETSASSTIIGILRSDLEGGRLEDVSRVEAVTGEGTDARPDSVYETVMSIDTDRWETFYGDEVSASRVEEAKDEIRDREQLAESDPRTFLEDISDANEDTIGRMFTSIESSYDIGWGRRGHARREAERIGDEIAEADPSVDQDDLDVNVDPKELTPSVGLTEDAQREIAQRRASTLEGEMGYDVDPENISVGWDSGVQVDYDEERIEQSFREQEAIDLGASRETIDEQGVDAAIAEDVLGVERDLIDEQGVDAAIAEDVLGVERDLIDEQGVDAAIAEGALGVDRQVIEERGVSDAIDEEIGVNSGLIEDGEIDTRTAIREVQAQEIGVDRSVLEERGIQGASQVAQAEEWGVSVDAVDIARDEDNEEEWWFELNLEAVDNPEADVIEDQQEEFATEIGVSPDAIEATIENGELQYDVQEGYEEEFIAEDQTGQFDVEDFDVNIDGGELVTEIDPEAQERVAREQLADDFDVGVSDVDIEERDGEFVPTPEFEEEIFERDLQEEYPDADIDIERVDGELEAEVIPETKEEDLLSDLATDPVGTIGSGIDTATDVTVETITDPIGQARDISSALQSGADEAIDPVRDFAEDPSVLIDRAVPDDVENLIEDPQETISDTISDGVETGQEFASDPSEFLSEGFDDEIERAQAIGGTGSDLLGKLRVVDTPEMEYPEEGLVIPTSFDDLETEEFVEDATTPASKEEIKKTFSVAPVAIGRVGHAGRAAKGALSNIGKDVGKAPEAIQTGIGAAGAALGAVGIQRQLNQETEIEVIEEEFGSEIDVPDRRGQQIQELDVPTRSDFERSEIEAPQDRVSDPSEIEVPEDTGLQQTELPIVEDDFDPSSGGEVPTIEAAPRSEGLVRERRDEDNQPEGIVTEGTIQGQERGLPEEIQNELERFERATEIREAEERGREQAREDVEQRWEQEDYEPYVSDQPGGDFVADRPETYTVSRDLERSDAGEYESGWWRSQPDDELSPRERMLEAQRARESENLREEAQQSEVYQSVVQEGEIEDLRVPEETVGERQAQQQTDLLREAQAATLSQGARSRSFEGVHPSVGEDQTSAIFEGTDQDEAELTDYGTALGLESTPGTTTDQRQIEDSGFDSSADLFELPEEIGTDTSNDYGEPTAAEFGTENPTATDPVGTEFGQPYEYVNEVGTQTQTRRRRRPDIPLPSLDSDGFEGDDEFFGIADAEWETGIADAEDVWGDDGSTSDSDSEGWW